MTQQRLEIQPGRVTLRRVTRQASNVAGSTAALNSFYLPSRAGINGDRGFMEGSYERRLNEEGPISLTFPNGAGEDGQSHRDRFAIILNGKLTPQGGNVVTASIGGAYRPGDEFIEIWRSQGTNAPGDLLAVMCITSATLTPATIVLNGYDALWLLKKTRETACGFWVESPHDVFDAYTRAWTPLVADDFTGLSLGSAWSSTLANGGTVTAKGSQSIVTLVAAGGASPGSARITSVASLQAGSSAADAHQPFRLEARITPTIPLQTNGPQMSFGLNDNAGNEFASILLLTSPTGISPIVGAPFGTNFQTAAPLTPGPHTFAIEGHGRWLYWLIDGTLIATLPMPAGATTSGATTLFPYIRVLGGSSAGTGQLDVDFCVARIGQRFLNRGSVAGDYQLPGAPTVGGLIASYFSGADLNAKFGFNNLPGLMPRPTDAPILRQQEPNIAGGAIPTAPVAVPRNWMMARWTGSVYLKLSGGNYGFTVTIPDAAQSYARAWVGKTRIGEAIIGATTWATGSTTLSGTVNAAALGGSDGWYSVTVEYLISVSLPASTIATLPTVAFTAPVAYTDPGGTAITTTSTTIPATSLSPVGIWEKQVRLESHYDQLIAIGKDYGHQFTCEPMSLESGEFPGRIVPRVRQGRDTEFIVKSDETADMQDDINAEEVCDTLLADATGLADPNGNSQLTAEVFNFAQLGLHLFVSQEYEQQNDVTIDALLRQRLGSLLALRGSPWEQVAATPRGTRQLLDTFPLTGAAAEFAWVPGDGVRLKFPELSLTDQSPRQILGVQWPIRPDGLGVPSASFRQRPRDFRRILRDMIYQQQQPNRYYQGQLVAVTGSVGGNTGMPDTYSRVNLPATLASVVRATLVVQTFQGGGTWTAEVNDVAASISVTGAGRFDITKQVAQIVAGEPRMYARLTGGPAAGIVTYQIELLVKV